MQEIGNFKIMIINFCQQNTTVLIKYLPDDKIVDKTKPHK